MSLDLLGQMSQRIRDRVHRSETLDGTACPVPGTSGRFKYTHCRSGSADALAAAWSRNRRPSLSPDYTANSVARNFILSTKRTLRMAAMPAVRKPNSLRVFSSEYVFLIVP